MLAESSAFHHRLKPPIFTKKPLLQISALRRFNDNTSVHLEPNKLSDKLNRRDIQFYDLYKFGKPEEDLNSLLQSQLSREGVLNAITEPQRPQEEQEEDGLYGDIEVDDFNQLWKDPDTIKNKFGQSIKVTLNFNKTNGTISHEVKEDLTAVKDIVNSSKNDKRITSKEDVD